MGETYSNYMSSIFNIVHHILCLKILANFWESPYSSLLSLSIFSSDQHISQVYYIKISQSSSLEINTTFPIFKHHPEKHSCMVGGMPLQRIVYFKWLLNKYLSRAGLRRFWARGRWKWTDLWERLIWNTGQIEQNKD